MNPLNFLPLILFFFPIYLLSVTHQLNFEGIATDYEGNILFTEKHEQIYEENIIIKGRTQFFDVKGQLIAQLDSDFVNLSYIPNYIMQNFRRKKIDSVTVKNNFVFIEVQKKDKIKSKTIPLENNAIFGEGLFFFLQNNIPRFLANQKVRGKILSTGRFRFFEIIAKVIKKNDKEILIDVTSENFFLRLFVPRTQILYDIENKRLISYEGIAPIRDVHGHAQQVFIKYQYSHK